MKRAAIVALIVSAAFLGSSALAGEILSGRAAVLDGDTLRIRGTIVGLHGIVAPALSQKCESAAGKKIACGMIAAQALAAHVGEAVVSCDTRGIDAYRRTIAVCRLGDEDLGAFMATNGLAVADRLRTTDYAAHSAKAWAKRRGLWAGVFEDPSERKREDYSAKLQIGALDK